MTKKMLAGLVWILLLSAFACTKESASTNRQPSIAAQSSDDLITDESGKLIVKGFFTFFYSWGCGTFSKTSIVINPDFTFTDGQGGTGTWVKNNKILMFHYNNSSDVTYTGLIGRTTIDGISGGFSSNPPSKGCFQLVKGAVRVANEYNGDMDASGKPRHN